MRYAILGTAQASGDDGTPVAVGGTRLRALLTALALRPGRAVPVHLLVEQVWDGDRPADAPAALQALVGRLRRALGHGAVRSVEGGYLLVAASEDVDLYRFERLVRSAAAAQDPAEAAARYDEALALWRGPALADLPESAAESARWEAVRMDARRGRLAAALALGQAERALPELTALCGERPLDEPLQVLRIRALRDTGRAAEALAAYDTVRRHLATRLGTDPGPALRALHTQLLAPAPAPAPDPPSAPASGVYPAPAAGPHSAPAGGRFPGPASGPAVGSAFGQAQAQAPGPDVAPASGQASGLVSGTYPAPAGGRFPGPPSGSHSGPAPAAHLVPAPGPVSGSPFVPVSGPAGSGDGGRSPFSGPGNLRVRLTSFVGREDDIRVIGEDLGRARLVTLLGAGGAGKTRLSQEAAEHAAQAWPDGVWFVELAPVDDPEDVAEAALTALGARETKLRGGAAEELRALTERAGDEPLERLAEHCARRRMLLILDNCEHVVGAAAELAEELLARCPGVRILATSREPLAVPGELLRPVEPLPDPVALRLLGERGAAARPGFRTDDDPEAAAEICRRLDGLPLAIELAAARLRLLTPRQIADRLDDRFRLLTGGARTVLPRQQTLRAVVDWSWELLDDRERTVLRRLSVFAGGCDLPAAEAVCSGAAAEDVADLLGSLVDKSLVVAAPGPDDTGMRYRMLETIREYAAERAAAHEADRAAVTDRHAAHFLALAEEAEPLLRGASQLPWIRRIETELDNLRAALLHTTRSGTTENAERLVLALGWFWWLRNYRIEGVEWTARIIELSPVQPPEGTPAYWRFMRAQMLHVLLLAEGHSPEEFRTPQNIDLADRIQQVFRGAGPETAGFPGMLWPMTTFLTGETLAVLEGLDETVDNCRRHGGDWELGITLLLRTHVAIDFTGGLSSVTADLAELHEIAHRVGDRWLRAQVASAAGEVALSRGRYDWARIEYEECLRLAREVGAHIEVPFAMARIAESAFCSGDFAGAEKLLAEAALEVERYGGVYDARAYGGMLTALLALVRGDLERARTEARLARIACGKINAPPQLTAGLDNIDAILIAREQGPEAGLSVLAPALATAVAAHCAERVLAALTDTAAVLLADAGRNAEAVRALAAATAWRAGHPRSVPEQAAVAALPEATRAALGPDRHRAEETAGAQLSPAEVAALVTAVAAVSGS